MPKPLFSLTAEQAALPGRLAASIVPSAYEVFLVLTTRALDIPYAIYGASLVIPYRGSLPLEGQASARWYAEGVGDRRPDFMMAVAGSVLATLEHPAAVTLYLPTRALADSFQEALGSLPVAPAVRLAFAAECRDIELAVDVLDRRASPRLSRLQEVLDQTPADQVFEDGGFPMTRLDLAAYDSLLEA